jgi:YVTN family beta-propeller protein
MRFLALFIQVIAAWASYSDPEELVVSRDGAALYVTCSGRDEVVKLNAASGAVEGRVRVGRRPRGLVLSESTLREASLQEAARLYVVDSWDDFVEEIDAGKMAPLRRFRVGMEPVGVALDEGVNRVFTANRISGDVSVVDLASGLEAARVEVGPGASYLASDGHGHIYVSRIYPNADGPREAPVNEIVEIDAGSLRVVTRKRIEGAGAVFHVAVMGASNVLLAPHLRPMNLLPTARVEHGGVFVNALAVIVPGVQAPRILPLDAMERAFAQPFGMAVDPDIRRVFVTGSGADEVAVLDARKLLKVVPGAGVDLSAANQYLISRIPVGRDPRGIALSPNGRTLYVANRLDDSISVIDLGRKNEQRVLRIGSLEPDASRRGEQLFYSARFAFGRQFSCASCHLDGIADGLTWDFEQDGFGTDIVSTKSMEALALSAPYKWNGSNRDLETECGIMAERYFFRSEGIRGRDLGDLVTFLKALPARPNRWRLKDGALTEAQARGKQLFDRARTVDGRVIFSPLRCGTCHSGPVYTSGQLADVGTKKETDRTGSFDTPQLVNVAYKRNFLHDGSAQTLQEVFTRFNAKDLHGVTSDLSGSQIDDLVEYLKTL